MRYRPRRGGEPQGKIDKDKFPYEKTQGIGDEKYAESLPEYRHAGGGGRST
jgi:hypothetical protein